MQESLDEGNLTQAEELWPDVLAVIALWKRNEVLMRVITKREVRKRVRAQTTTFRIVREVARLRTSLEEYDKDYSALGLENERLREQLRQLK